MLDDINVGSRDHDDGNVEDCDNVDGDDGGNVVGDIMDGDTVGDINGGDNVDGIDSGFHNTPGGSMCQGGITSSLLYPYWMYFKEFSCTIA